MNIKKYLVAAIVLNTVLSAFTGEAQRGIDDLKGMALTGPSGKFGPVIETLLPASETSVDMLDLETGRTLLQPPFEHFDSRVDAIMSWIRSNGLDISCSLWPGGAMCVTYDMTIVPVEGKSWEETTEQELLNDPALAPVNHAPRRMLVLGHNGPDTYIFRTGEGTLGILRIVGLGQQKRGVKIRYKLINPANSVAARRLSDSQRAVVSR